ncbi:hypothetical protein HDU96_010149 [Phlyctochytrium bullatum]|nr:hypothetical protein HDU96_010149 [Phlyctochytrium bullatum]
MSSGTFLLPTSWCGPSKRRYPCGYTNQNLCTVILISDTDSPPFLDADPNTSAAFKEKIYVKYNRKVNLAGFPAPTAFTSATATAFTLPATRGFRPTMTGGFGNGGGGSGDGWPWNDGPTDKGPNPTIISVAIAVFFFCILCCWCVAMSDMAKQTKKRRAALNAELSAIEAGIPAHMRENAFAYGSAMQQANFNANAVLPTYSAASKDTTKNNASVYV